MSLMKSELRVMFVIQGLSRGGAERFLTTLANWLNEKEVSVTILSLARVDKDAYYLGPGIEVLSLHQLLSSGADNALARNWRTLRGIRAEIRRVDPNVCIGVMSTSAVLLGISGCFQSRRQYIGAERIYPPYASLNIVWRMLRFVFYGALDNVVVQTEQGSDWIKRHTLCRHTLAIPNPILLPLQSQPPIVSIADRRLHGSKTLLAVGRLEVQKNYPFLIRCFAKIAEDNANWRLLICGDGSEHGRLDSLIQSLGLQDRVILLGRVGNIADYFELADITVFSSLYEGYPNSILESMAHGVPVIATDCKTGPSELIDDGVNGFVVANGDDELFCERMTTLMRDGELRRKFSNASKTVLRTNSMDKIGEQWMKLFRGDSR